MEEWDKGKMKVYMKQAVLLLDWEELKTPTKPFSPAADFLEKQDYILQKNCHLPSDRCSARDATGVKWALSPGIAGMLFSRDKAVIDFLLIMRYRMRVSC